MVGRWGAAGHLKLQTQKDVCVHPYSSIHPLSSQAILKISWHCGRCQLQILKGPVLSTEGSGVTDGRSICA